MPNKTTDNTPTNPPGPHAALPLALCVAAFATLLTVVLNTSDDSRGHTPYRRPVTPTATHTPHTVSPHPAFCPTSPVHLTPSPTRTPAGNQPDPTPTKAPRPAPKNPAPKAPAQKVPAVPKPAPPKTR